MEQITVRELASEFDMKSSLVISELKKIGVWVPSSATQVDSDIANRIRKRLQMITEAEQEEKDKKGDRSKKAAGSRVRRSIKDLGKAQKRGVKKKAEEAEPETETLSPLAGSLKPRKGKRSLYRKADVEAVEIVEVPVEEVLDIVGVVTDLEAEEVQVEAAEVVEMPPVVVEPEEAEEEEVEFEEELPAAEVAQVATPVALEPVVEEPAEPVAEPVAAEEIPVPKAVPTETAAPVKAPAKEVAPVEAKAAPKKKIIEPVEAGAGLEQEEAEPAKRPKSKRAMERKKQKKERKKAEGAGPSGAPDAASGSREIIFSEKVTVKSFAEKTGIRSNEIISALFQKGVMVTVNQDLPEELVESLCEKFELVPSFVTFEEAAARKDTVEDLPEDLETRAPVVTVMGHVDHGKTTLLDYIRDARVAEGEAGGITQHIGAYQVFTKNQKIVFIDTPGHEAFTRMRARGAQATDIVVLVVAADDGVMPQTIEAMDHAKAAGVPIIVAINKIDKPGSNPDRVKQELSERGLLSEDWGGDTVMLPVSAKQGTNVDELLDMILLVSEMLESKANPSRSGAGVILEAKMEKGRGAVATLLVQNGTLRVGDTFIAGAAYGRVRAMFDDLGEGVEEAGPSSAVEVLGLQGMPQAGDVFQVVDDQAKAREMVQYRLDKLRELELAKSAKVSLDDLYAQMTAGDVKELPIVLKADTQGSVEVLDDTLVKLSAEKVKVQIIRSGVGAINESDVLLASASNAIVIGFNVRPDGNARVAAEHEGVEVRLYSVIYDVANEIRQAMVGLLPPTLKEKTLGRAEVRDTFKVPRVGTVAGCYVLEGTMVRNAEVRLLRDNVVVYQGKFGSLKRFKDDVGEVREGYECGISIANFNDVKLGDVLEAFSIEEIAPELT